MSNKTLIASILVFILAGIAIFLAQPPTEKDYEFSGTVETVQKYFEGWGKQDWPNVYSVISDGFKKIEPTAKTLSDFKQYIQSQNITGAEIISIKEKSNDGKTAIVEYSVEFVLANNAKRPFSGSFTLKQRDADIIRGWKITNPYGDRIDTS